MEIALNPELQKFAEQQARREGCDDASAYIARLLDREWKRQIGQLASDADLQSLNRRLAEGAERRRDRDRQIARDWEPLEEELYGEDA